MSYLLLLLFAMAPLYVWRFNVGIPVNFLEIFILLFWLVFAAWLLAKEQLQNFAYFLRGQPRVFLLFIALFILSAFISTAISADKHRALGQLVTFFIEPAGTYFIAAYI